MKSIYTECGPFQYPNYIVEEKDYGKALRQLITKAPPTCGLDIETAKRPKYKDHPRAGLDPYLSQIRLLQIYDGERVWIFDLFKIKTGLKDFGPFLRSRKFYAHYALFEIQHLAHAGFPDLDIGCSMILDQLIYNADNAGVVLEESDEEYFEENPEGVARYKANNHSLAGVTNRLFKFELDKQLQTSDWSKPELSKEQYVYAGSDAVLTYHIAKILSKKVKEYGMWPHYSLLKKSQHALSDMQLNGMPVDSKLHTELIEQWDDKRGEAQRKCYGYFKDTNLNSSPQMEKWLENYLKKDPELLARWPKTPKGKYSFNAAAIADFSHLDPIKYLLQYKQWQKLVSTYGVSIQEMMHPVTGRLHTEFTLSETRTGRMSSRRPNLQNQPTDSGLREIFAVSKGSSLIVADFSQIELRIQSELSRDPVMRKVYKENGDIYITLAEQFFKKKIDKEKNPEERKFGKVVMLALGYGMGATMLVKRSRMAGVKLPDNDIVRAHASYRKLFQRYISWCDETRAEAAQLGYARTMLGKMRRIAADKVYTQAPNLRVQGSAAELMLLAVCRIRKNLGSRGKLLCVVHDELLCECPNANAEEVSKIVKDGMCWAMEYLFPRAVSFDVTQPKICRHWAEK